MCIQLNIHRLFHPKHFRNFNIASIKIVWYNKFTLCNSDSLRCYFCLNRFHKFSIMSLRNIILSSDNPTTFFITFSSNADDIVIHSFKTIDAYYYAKGTSLQFFLNFLINIIVKTSNNYTICYYFLV